MRRCSLNRTFQVAIFFFYRFAYIPSSFNKDTLIWRKSRTRAELQVQNIHKNPRQR
ncbi:hypothetical protein ACS0TY_009160 [Phlomoides rotata]